MSEQGAFGLDGDPQVRGARRSRWGWGSVWTLLGLGVVALSLLFLLDRTPTPPIWPAVVLDLLAVAVAGLGVLRDWQGREAQATSLVVRGMGLLVMANNIGPVLREGSVLWLPLLLLAGAGALVSLLSFRQRR
ncbi:hypothetical protein Dcar01_00241 [Deinococcus carri]|uniref:Uncharacterized protein n=1 Tax=Deinococcus carri TaxID=1211323 RepID=A0ABP9W2E3_9DEIO